MFTTLTTFGINAAIFGMVAHGLITGMLFFIAGSVQHNYGTRELSRLGGLLKQAPKMGWILGFCAMASLGLPGLAGFWGEFPAVLSTFNPGGNLSQPLFRTYMVVAAIGTVLAAGYLLWMLQKVAFGVPKPEFAGGVKLNSFASASSYRHLRLAGEIRFRCAGRAKRLSAG